MKSQNMGVIDADLVFSDNTAFSATGNSGILDIGFSDPNIGSGGQHLVRVFCHSVASGTDTASLTFEVQDSADKSSWGTIIRMDVAANALKKGDAVVIPLPQESRRYLRVAVTKPTAAAARNLTIDLTSGP